MAPRLMKILIDTPKYDHFRFNQLVVKTETAGKLLNYYGDIFQRIEMAISQSEVKRIPEKVADVPVFQNLVNNKTYTNVFHIKMNNVHSIAEEIQSGLVYLEKLTMSNRSRWLKKHFKDEIKMFASTYKEVVVKSYYDVKDRNNPLKYDIIFNFNGVNPENQAKFAEIKALSREKVSKDEVMDAIQKFIDATNSQDINIISKAQLLDLIEQATSDKYVIDEEYKHVSDFDVLWKPICPMQTNTTSLYDEGKKYHPQLKLKKFTKDDYTTEDRYYLQPNSMNYYTGARFFHHMIHIKIDEIMSRLQKHLPVAIRYSKTSPTVYFTLNQERFRLSNHRKGCYFEPKPEQIYGYDISIFPNTDVDDAVAKILSAAKISA